MFLRGNECFYDEALPLKEDYDMTLQQLRRHRIALRLNKYFYRVKQSEQVGGCATYRNLDKEREQLETPFSSITIQSSNLRSEVSETLPV